MRQRRGRHDAPPRAHALPGMTTARRAPITSQRLRHTVRARDGRRMITAGRNALLPHAGPRVGASRSAPHGTFSRGVLALIVALVSTAMPSTPSHAIGVHEHAQGVARSNVGVLRGRTSRTSSTLWPPDIARRRARLLADRRDAALRRNERSSDPRQPFRRRIPAHAAATRALPGAVR